MANTNWHEKHKVTMSLGDRIADSVANGMGSWNFIIWQTVIVILWMTLNIIGIVRHWDPYPFILLNLVLSFQAAYTGPIVMMSQNRQEARDRARAQHDYQVNLKAELEIRQLHQKVDHMLSHQWERLVEIQEVQIELINEVRSKR